MTDRLWDVTFFMVIMGCVFLLAAAERRAGYQAGFADGLALGLDYGECASTTERVP